MSGRPEMARCSVCGELHPAATTVTAHRDPRTSPTTHGARGPSRWTGGSRTPRRRTPSTRARSSSHPRTGGTRSRPGELVKLGFAYGPHADREGQGHVERMWVEVLDQDAAGTGHRARAVRNRPHRLAELEIGDVVAFGAHEVLSIDFSDEELGSAQDEWPIDDRAVLEHDRAPDVVVRYDSPREGEAETARWRRAGGGWPGPYRSLERAAGELRAS